jgi:putative flippase GtrA
MIAYSRVRLERLLKIEFIRFCIVGGTGFVINLILLLLLHKALGINIFVSEWIYKAHKVEKTLTNLLVQFHLTSWPAIIGSALMVTGGEKLLHLSNVVALVVSSVIALLWNFVWSKFVVWRDVDAKEIEEIAS